MRLVPFLLFPLLACHTVTTPSSSDASAASAATTTTAAPLLVDAGPAAAPTGSARYGSLPEADTKLAASSNALGFDLYRKLPAGDGALSPVSIQLALAMASAGAKGETAAQLHKVMHSEAPADAWGKLGVDLHDHGAELRVANRLFADRAYPLEKPYVDLTAKAFGAPVEALDFRGKSEAARGQINGWVAEQTHDRIKDLIPVGGISGSTRLVLTNAIYMNAEWDRPFERDATHNDTFHLDATRTKSVPMMHRQESLRSGRTDGAAIVQLPYRNDTLTMTVVVPDAMDGLAAIESKLSNELLARIDKALGTQQTVVGLPKFTIDPASSLSLKRALAELGMPVAFDAGRADFSGIAHPANPDERLVMDDVIHKAFVKVDEKGTEAAAATAITMRAVGSEMEPEKPFSVVADRPFLFLVRERSSGLVLFLGRVTDPR